MIEKGEIKVSARARCGDCGVVACDDAKTEAGMREQLKLHLWHCVGGVWICPACWVARNTKAAANAGSTK